MKIKIVTDSTSYLPQEYRDEYNIDLVSLNVTFGTESIREMEIDNETFYQRMAKSPEIPFSSQPTLQELYKAFAEPVQSGAAVVGIFMSSGLSGTYQTALMVRDMVLEKHPEGVIEVIDSKTTAMEMGFVVLAAAKAAQAGQALAGVLDQAWQVMKKTRFLFTPEVLEYLRKGGRIGGAQALLGALLQIKPILTVLEGKAAVFDKVRTKGRALEEMIRVFLEDVKAKGLGEIVVHHINNEHDGMKLVAMIEKSLGIKASILPIGPVVGLHVGPGTVGLAYYTAV